MVLQIEKFPLRNKNINSEEKYLAELVANSKPLGKEGNSVAVSAIHSEEKHDFAEKKAKKLGKRPAIRLNGGSDLDWSRFYETYQDVMFW